jgi:hypothetical protein
MEFAVGILQAELKQLEEPEAVAISSTSPWALTSRSSEIRKIMVLSVNDLIQAAQASKSVAGQSSGSGLYGD